MSCKQVRARQSHGKTHKRSVPERQRHWQRLVPEKERQGSGNQRNAGYDPCKVYPHPEEPGVSLKSSQVGKHKVDRCPKESPSNSKDRPARGIPVAERSSYTSHLFLPSPRETCAPLFKSHLHSLASMPPAKVLPSRHTHLYQLRNRGQRAASVYRTAATNRNLLTVAVAKQRGSASNQQGETDQLVGPPPMTLQAYCTNLDALCHRPKRARGCWACSSTVSTQHHQAKARVKASSATDCSRQKLTGTGTNNSTETTAAFCFQKATTATAC